MNKIENFFTLTSIVSFGGASLALVVMTNTLRKLTGWNSPWIPFLGSLIIVVVAAYQLGTLKNVLDGFVVLLNACLLFCNALGINEGIAPSGRAGGALPQGRKAIRFFSSWKAKN